MMWWILQLVATIITGLITLSELSRIDNPKKDGPRLNGWGWAALIGVYIVIMIICMEMEVPA